MKHTSRINLRSAKRFVHVLLVSVILAGVLLPLYNLQHAAAAGAQLTSREIKLSDSSASSNGVTTHPGNGLNVTYRVTFTVSTAADSLVIDFCGDSPIIGDSSCSVPTSMDVSTAALSNVSGPITSANWTATGSNTGNPHVKISDNTLNAHPIGPSDSVSGVESFDLTGITNPSTTGTFYARIVTYNSNIFDQDDTLGTTGDNYSSASTLGTYLDYGGIALTTVKTISISARVQESLTFCINADPQTTGGAGQGDPTLWVTTHTCDDTVVTSNPPTMTIGTFAGTTKVLSPTVVDHENMYSQISTNATHGVIVRIVTSNTACGGLSADGGTSCPIAPVPLLPGACNIDGSGGTGCLAQQIQTGASSGNAEFGLFASNGENDPGTTSPGGAQFTTVNANTCLANEQFNAGSPHELADPNVAAQTGTYYGMPWEVSNAAGISSTFGAIVFQCSGPVYRVDNWYQFAATPSLSTPAGIYKTNMSMIATATF